MTLISLVLTLFLTIIAPSTAYADLLEFANGDRLYGKIISIQNSEITFDSDMIGTIKVPLSEHLINIHTTEPLNISFINGMVSHQQLAIVNKTQVIIDDHGIITPLVWSEIKAIHYQMPLLVNWSNQFTAGLSLEQGNTESQDTYLDITISRKTDNTQLVLDFEYQENREESPSTGKTSTSKRRYQTNAHYKYFVANHLFLYANLMAEKEVTENLNLRLTASSGAGYKWFDTVNSYFDTEAGLAWVDENFTDDSSDNQYISLRTAWQYYFDINNQIRLYHNGSLISGLENTQDQLVKIEAGIKSKLTSTVSLEAKLVYDFDNTPAAGKHKGDTIYIFGIGWSI